MPRQRGRSSMAQARSERITLSKIGNMNGFVAPLSGFFWLGEEFFLNN
jgi:hypothetical protein